MEQLKSQSQLGSQRVRESGSLQSNLKGEVQSKINSHIWKAMVLVMPMGAINRVFQARVWKLWSILCHLYAAWCPQLVIIIQGVSYFVGGAIIITHGESFITGEDSFVIPPVTNHYTHSPHLWKAGIQLLQEE